MKVLPINNFYSGNHENNKNFSGKFVMNDSLYVHNITASAEELNAFRNTLKKIETVSDNLRFSLEADKKWYSTWNHGIWGRDYTWVYKLFKQDGQDETTKEQLGNTIYCDEDAEAYIEDTDYKMVQPSELLTEISLRLKKFYSHQKIFGMFNEKNTDKDYLRKEIDEITIPNLIGVGKWLDSLCSANQ